MEAVFLNRHFKADVPFEKVLDSFFSKNTPDSAWTMFFKLFQCWALKDCNIKAEISDAEVALFFDQLNYLVAAAYHIHEANRASENAQEGKEHD